MRPAQRVILPLEQNIAYSDTTGSPLKTVTKGWTDQFSLGCEVDTWGSSGPSSAVFYTYGPGDVVTDVKEYDYGLVTPSSCFNGAMAPSGVTPTRETVTTYQAFNSTTYTTSPSLLNSPCRVVVKNSSGIASETDYFYDGGTSVCGAAGTPSVADVPLPLPLGTHDETLFGASKTTSRGNVTRVQRVNAGGSPITTMEYDVTGQVTSVTDPCGNNGCSDMGGTAHTTTYSHLDNYSVGTSSTNTNAYLTKVTSPATNGGMHVQNYSYGYQDGQLGTSTDENNQQTTYTYNDPLDRLTEIQGPLDPNNGNQRPTTTYTYSDVVFSPSVTTSQFLSGTEGWKTSVSVMDGMGHPIWAQLTSDPSGTDYVHTTYDGNGRVYSVTNPYRSPPGPNDPPTGTTYYTYDALGRKTLELESDEISSLHWSYPGNTTISVDENNHSWVRTTDALGRLISVAEPNGGSTTYSYSPLNDLLTITQPGLSGETARITRKFSYDSLSRLVATNNPETASSANPASLTCAPNGPWTTCYTYDLNGNLQAKTDNRNITVNYSYDGLNRLVGKTYSGVGAAASASAAATASSCYQYDTNSFAASSGNFLGRLTSEWTQSGPCPASVPTGGYKTLRSILSYDPMGHVKTEQQCNFGTCTTGLPYTATSSYDLAGNEIAYTNWLQNLSFTKTYDAVGRLRTAIKDAVGSSPEDPLIFVGNYSPAGAIQSMILGFDAVVTKTYDSRLRPTSETVVHP